MRRADEGKRAKSIRDFLGRGQAVTVTLGKSPPKAHQGWTKIRRTMTSGQMRRRILLRDTEELLGQLERNVATRYSDPALTLRNGSEKTERNNSSGHSQRNGRSQITKWKRSARISRKPVMEKQHDGHERERNSANASERNAKDRLMGSRAKLPSGLWHDCRSPSKSW